MYIVNVRRFSEPCFEMNSTLFIACYHLRQKQNWVIWFHLKYEGVNKMSTLMQSCVFFQSYLFWVLIPHFKFRLNLGSYGMFTNKLPQSNRSIYIFLPVNVYFKNSLLFTSTTCWSCTSVLVVIRHTHTHTKSWRTGLKGSQLTFAHTEYVFITESTFSNRKKQ